MNGQFGPAAVRLAGLSARTLGWRPGEFWAATPAELLAAFADPAGQPGYVDRATLDRMMEQDRHGR